MARILGVLLFGAAAVAATAGALAEGGAASAPALREVAPLAAAIGGLIGASVFGAAPGSARQALVLGPLSALVALVFFSALLLFGDGLIVAVTGGAPEQAVGRAAERLAERLPFAAPLTVAAFTAASLLAWALGALGRRLRRLRRGADPAK